MAGSMYSDAYSGGVMVEAMELIATTKSDTEDAPMQFFVLLHMQRGEKKGATRT